jgi:hypothetical protein
LWRGFCAGWSFAEDLSFLVWRVLSCQDESKPAASKEYKQNEYKKLKQDNVDCIDAGAGVSEPGLNRRPDNMIA